MEECAKVIDTQGVQAERATMPLAAAVADLLKGVIFHLLYGLKIAIFMQLYFPPLKLMILQLAVCKSSSYPLVLNVCAFIHM
jgi:hypothetical protein